jgi:hypothetical protein
MRTAVLLFVKSALQLQLVVSNLTTMCNNTKFKDAMCDATHACLDGEHCCYKSIQTAVQLGVVTTALFAMRHRAPAISSTIAKTAQ